MSLLQRERMEGEGERRGRREERRGGRLSVSFSHVQDGTRAKRPASSTTRTRVVALQGGRVPYPPWVFYAGFGFVSVLSSFRSPSLESRKTERCVCILPSATSHLPSSFISAGVFWEVLEGRILSKRKILTNPDKISKRRIKKRADFPRSKIPLRLSSRLASGLKRKTPNRRQETNLGKQ